MSVKWRHNRPWRKKISSLQKVIIRIKISLKIPAVRTLLHIFGEIKACFNSSNSFLSEEVETHAQYCVTEKAGGFCPLLLKTVYCVGYISVCWNKTGLRAILTRLITILVMNINICTIDSRRKPKCRSDVQFSTNTQGFFTSGQLFLWLNKM